MQDTTSVGPTMNDQIQSLAMPCRSLMCSLVGRSVLQQYNDAHWLKAAYEEPAFVPQSFRQLSPRSFFILNNKDSRTPRTTLVILTYCCIESLASPGAHIPAIPDSMVSDLCLTRRSQERHGIRMCEDLTSYPKPMDMLLSSTAIYSPVQENLQVLLISRSAAPERLQTPS